MRSSIGKAVLLAFLLTQALDVAFTYVGVRAFGPSIEANPLVAWYMSTFGALAGLLGVKAMTIVSVAALHWRAMHRTIGLLTLFYLATAVLPWAVVLWL